MKNIIKNILFLLPLLSLLAPMAHANRALMESTTATAMTVFVDTGNTQVVFGTNTYGGGISNVKVYVSSHLVVGPDNGCVVFSTGSIACKGNEIVGNCLTYSTGSVACTGNVGAGTVSSFGNATVGNCIVYSTGSVACTGAISGPWTRSGTNVILTNTGDNVGIGVSPTDSDGFGGNILDNNGAIYARKAGSANFAVMAMFGGETSIDAGGTGNILKLFTNGAEGVRIAANRHVEFTGAAPTVGTCGTTPSVVGNDNAGIITVGGGVVTACTLTFASAWLNTAVCTVSDDSASISAAVTTATTTSIIIGLSASGSTKIYYVCRGYR